MTDWDRVDRLRSKGWSWQEIAEDPKVGFRAESGLPAGRSLKILYERGRVNPRKRRARTGGRLASDRPRRRWVAWSAGAVALVLFAGVLAFLLITPISGVNVVTYCGGEGTAAHYHPLLVINDNGVQQHLPYDSSQPADIGYLNSPGFTNPSLYCATTAAGPGIHALHTHDGSGIIHAELPSRVQGTPSLGDFFQIWGEPLNSSSVWTFTGSVTATVLDMDTGARTTYSADPTAIPLYQPAAGPFGNAYAIPSSLIFGGTYGGGQSGGLFSGEIIWLNVSSSPTAIASLGGMGVAGGMGFCTCALATMCSAPMRPTSERSDPSAGHLTGAVNQAEREYIRVARPYPTQ